MPVHDWSRVPDGTFHDFHATWIPMLKVVLNEEVLPPGYYAMAEQVAGIIPDVLTLQSTEEEHEVILDSTSDGGTALLTTRPQATVSARLQESAIYAAKANRLVIRHQSHDRVIAILEVLSAGNKSTQSALGQFVKKVIDALWQGIHLLIIDLHAPTPRDPNGIHAAIWEALDGQQYAAPQGKPLTLAAYSAFSYDNPIEAFVEPLAIGDPLPAMPLFLAPGSHVMVPLELSYTEAVQRIPRRARAPLDE